MGHGERGGEGQLVAEEDEQRDGTGRLCEGSRAALAGTGAAFSGLGTFFNARRQLSRDLSSRSSFDSPTCRLACFSPLLLRFLLLWFPRATPPPPTKGQFLPPCARARARCYHEGRRHRHVFASENRESERFVCLAGTSRVPSSTHIIEFIPIRKKIAPTIYCTLSSDTTLYVRSFIETFGSTSRPFIIVDR